MSACADDRLGATLHAVLDATRRLLVLLTWGVCVLLTETAWAAAPDGAAVAVLPPQLEGEFEAHEVSQMEETVEQGLARSELSVVSVSDVRAVAPDGCGEADCAKRVAATLGVAMLLRTFVEEDGRDYVLRVEVLAGDTGEVLQKREATCDICGSAEVSEQLSNEAAALVPFIVEYTQGRAILEVQSDPPGARVKVDGQEVGTTPYKGEVLHGERSIEISKRGFTVRELERVVGKGTTTLVTVELDAVQEAKVGPHPVWGWLPLGLGVGAVGAGITLIAIEENPVPGRCDDPANVDEFGVCEFRYRTLEGGAVMLGVGVAAIAAGAAILGIRAKRKQQGSSVAFVPRFGGLGMRF
jgi:hypothetical protein